MSKDINDILRLSKFVLGNLRRGRKLPHRLFVDDEDLVQEAVTAGLERAPEWDPARGSFATYMVPILAQAITQYAWKDAKGGINTKQSIYIDSYDDIFDLLDDDHIDSFDIKERINLREVPYGYGSNPETLVEAEQSVIEDTYCIF